MSFNELLKKKIVIGVWVSPIPSSIVKQVVPIDESYKNAKDALIDFVHTIYENGSTENLINAFELMDNTGLYGFAYDSRLKNIEYDKEERYDLINKLKTHKSFIGLNIYDEPGANKFSSLVDTINEYKDLNCFINFLPIYATYNQLKTSIWHSERTATIEEYDDYLKEIEKLPLKYASYDFYPFAKEKGNLKENYFHSLYEWKKLAIKMNIPLWNFTQVTAFNKEMREIDEDEINFINNTAIAFGVTGIQYFTYFLPVDNKFEVFRGAPVNSDGTLTDKYDVIKRCNEDINKLGDKLINAEFIGVLSKGIYDNVIPNNAKINLDVSVDGKDYLCGVFKKNNKYILYLVNTNVFEEENYSINSNSINLRSNDNLKLSNIKIKKGGGILLYEE